MEIDVKKVVGEIPLSVYGYAHKAIKAQQEVLEALYIMKSTIDNWDSNECLELNKDRMIKYLNKFAE